MWWVYETPICKTRSTYMKQLIKSFLQVSLLIAVTAMSPVVASSCDTACSTGCSTDCSTACSTDCSTSCSTASTSSSCGSCHSVYIPRSTKSNSAYFWLPQGDIEQDGWNGALDLGFEYQQTFRGHDIAKCMFGSSTLVFQGSKVSDRSETALIAENFGLSQTFNGSLKLNPKIRNFNVHLQSKLGFDCFASGLYGQVNLTFTHQRRNLFDDNCVSTVSTGTGAALAFPVGYMSSTATTTTTPVADLKTALKGDSTFGDMQTAWKFGKFSFCDMTENKVAGVDLILGYNFWQSDCGHFGAFFQYTAPTGNKPSATTVFSPVVGNGKHHEVGGGIDAHYELWSNDCDQSITAYLNGFVVTLLKDCQVRSFDFAGYGCNSRYMLLKELTASTDATVGFTYAGNLINAINFTTRNVTSKFNVKGDASLRFVYHDGGINFALGYNLYGNSREKLCLNGTASPCSAVDTTKHYGIKGCSGVAYAAYATSGGVTAGTATLTSLNATQTDSATITACGTADNAATTLVSTDPGTVGVDWSNANLAGVQANAVPAGTAMTAIAIAQTSAPAVEILANSTTLNIRSGESPSQLISKGFATLDYTWTDCEWTPYLGVYAAVEGGSKRCDQKQWSVAIKGGVSF